MSFRMPPIDGIIVEDKECTKAQQVVTIPIEEYKELLITKGRYEELKST